MISRNRRGIRRMSMRARLAVAAAVLVGGGAAGVAAVAASHGPVSAQSAGYTTNYKLSESEAMSDAMNWWSKSPQTSFTVITKMVTITTVSTTSYHNKTLVVQRGTVIASAPGEFVVKSKNGQVEIWHANKGAQFVNIGGSQSGWNAMSGGTMSSYGSWNWSNSSNSNWNMKTKNLAKGDLVFVFGEKVHGALWAQLVLFAAPGSSSSQAVHAQPANNMPQPGPTSTMPTFAATNS